MRYETTQNVTLPKIGFGTWNIGGGSTADPSRDQQSLEALQAALDVGYSHIDTAETYADGHSEELVGEAIRRSGVKREDVFITSKVKPANLKYELVLQACGNSIKRLGLDYIDMYLIHWPSVGVKYEDAFKALNQLVREGKVRHLGVSNFNIKLLKKAQDLSETPIITNQVPFSLTDFSYIENGVLEYCQQNNILLTAYSPVDDVHVKPNKPLVNIAKAHGTTIYQIALAWIISHPRVITIPMSSNPVHIRENFEAANIELSKEEMQRLGA